MMGLTIFLPLYFEAVIGLPASASGAALIPLLVTSILATIFSGRSLAWVHHYKRVPMVGLTISIISLLLLTWHPDQPLLLVLLHLAAVGFGIGTVYPVATVAVQNAVPRHQLGITTGSFNFFRSLLASVTVALLGVILLGGINLKGGEVGLSVETLKASGGGTELALLFRWVFATIAAVLSMSLLALIRMEERPLPGRAEIDAATAGAPASAE
jgi:sugar phosphate permease